MTSRHNKCLAGSMLLHGLLLALLIFGPAFAPSRPAPVELAILNLIPADLILTDEKASGGGGPPGPLPAPAPTPAPAAKPLPPAPKPLPPAPKESTPLPEDIAPKNKTTPDPDSLVVKDSKTQSLPKHEVIPNLKLAKRSSSDTASEEEKRAADRRAQESARQAQIREEKARAAYREWQNKVDSAISGVAQNLSGRITIDTSGLEGGGGLGGGGPAYANYGQYVISFYNQNWVRPEDTTDSSLTVRVKIVVRRDGTVISDEIVKPSGHAAFDRSVQRVLERVRSIRPFPEGAQESQRTYFFNFQLLPKSSSLG